jgi:hypothetical protein
VVGRRTDHGVAAGGWHASTLCRDSIARGTTSDLVERWHARGAMALAASPPTHRRSRRASPQGISLHCAAPATGASLIVT